MKMWGTIADAACGGIMAMMAAVTTSITNTFSTAKSFIRSVLTIGLAITQSVNRHTDCLVVT